jgi:hypothetical protein
MPKYEVFVTDECAEEIIDKFKDLYDYTGYPARRLFDHLKKTFKSLETLPDWNTEVTQIEFTPLYSIKLNSGSKKSDRLYFCIENDRLQVIGLALENFVHKPENIDRHIQESWREFLNEPTALTPANDFISAVDQTLNSFDLPIQPLIQSEDTTKGLTL